MCRENWAYYGIIQACQPQLIKPFSKVNKYIFIIPPIRVLFPIPPSKRIISRYCLPIFIPHHAFTDLVSHILPRFGASSHIPQNLFDPERWVRPHLGISSSKRRHSDFVRRRSYTPYSTFNLTRPRSATSGDISPSHDLNNKLLYFEDGNMAAISILRRLIVYPIFIRQQQQLLIWLCARWMLAVLQTNLHHLLIPSINVMLTYL